MFDKIRFAQILKKISENYDNQRDFSKKSGINRTYLSQYINMKLDVPPKPSLLEKLANASHNITNYNELMSICGYTANSIHESYLDDIYYEKSRKIENEIYKIHLSKKEREVYEVISNTLNNRDTYSLDKSIISKKIDSYFEPIDWLSKTSKTKIKQKLFLFVDYISLPSKIVKKRHYKEDSIESQYTLDSMSSHKFYMCPVYGQISAGEPNWAIECIEGRIPIDPDLMGIVNPEEHFFLRVNGESMNKVIRNGAFALIHKQDDVEDGEIAVVLVNGYDATLKKFTRQGEFIILEPESTDESFKSQVYDKTTPIKILGKYVGKMELN